MFSSFLHRWLPRRSVQTFQRKRTKSCRSAKLLLESLESRDLLSLTATPFYEIYQSNNGASPMASPSPIGHTPGQIAQAYGFNKLSFSSGGTTVAANGAGETIAIVDAYNDPTIINDLHAFDKQFGLPDPSLQVLNQNGGTTLPGVDPSGGWEVEEALDVEWAHAMAPGANIVFIEANSDNNSDLFTAVRTAAAIPGVVAVSMSWGEGEFSNDGSGHSETWYDSNYFTAPASNPGVVFVASSGDSGAPPSYPAISPNVLAVGGTTLNLDGSGNYLGESAWGGSGGGVSTIEPRPSYQPSTYSNGTSSGASTMRMNPDVAYDADPNTGFAVYDSYNFGGTTPWAQFGGTSDAAPQWAALIAITDQGRKLAGESAFSGPTQLLPLLYSLPSDFHDITSGTTTGSPNYTAGTGYDLTTGLGSPIANFLVPDLITQSAPATPTGLTATAVSAAQINLTWNSDSGANTYTIERSRDDSTWSVVATTSATNYSDTGLQPTTTYYYRILASNGFGSSPYTAPVSATTLSDTASASFLKTDTTTEGNWQGVYGSQGYNVIDNGVSYPSYATVSASGNSSGVWTTSTTDPRALEDAVGSGRTAAVWWSASSFTINVNITDGQKHQLALYMLDWDQFGGGRSEQIQILDPATGAVLDSETASSFSNGVYKVWNVSGDVEIRVTNLNGGSNAVLSGLFFDPAGSGSSSSGSGSATFVKSDTATEGNWQGVYGSQGYNVIDNAVSYPSYATVSTSGNSNGVWTTSTTDPRALEDAVGSGRTAAVWWSGSNFTINVNITDGQKHQLALYLLDWDQFAGGRAEQVQILDATTGAVLDTETASNFANGDYLVWNVGGDVNIRITNLNGSSNAVLSGLFFDPTGSSSSGSGSATFVKSDTATEGNWQGVYGSDGYNVIDNAVSYPSYATVSASGNSNGVWTTSTTDPRALEDAVGSGRTAAVWWSASSFTINVNITDGQKHQLALYLLDWDQYAGGRSEQIQILDAKTGAVLDTETASNFANGDYLVWNVGGDINIRITNLNRSSNAVLSGLFFG